MDKKHIRDNYEIYNWKRIIQLMNYEKIIEIYNVRNVVSPPIEFYAVCSIIY